MASALKQTFAQAAKPHNGERDERQAMHFKDEPAGSLGYDAIQNPGLAINDRYSLSTKKRGTDQLDDLPDDENTQAKKAKLAVVDRPDMAQKLPAEIWHHICSLLPPRSLGNLLMVSKVFHHYLDPASRVKATPPVIPTPSILPALEADAIWRASRRLFWPRMPVPLQGRSELDMWRLACSRSCQFCRRRNNEEAGQKASSLPKWQTGPGARGVSPIFPFFIVSCGQCLGQRSIKEIDVMLSSSTPFFLAAGAPMVFLSSEMHVLPPQVIGDGGLPPTISLTKVFWPEQLDRLKADMIETMQLGSAAAHEWIKGIDVKGKGLLADLSRWEKWYLIGGVDLMRRSDLVLFPPPKPPAPSPKQEGWTKEQMASVRAGRRAEIERRAALLQPPIMPDVLANMPSFKAAVRSLALFDDEAWEHLRPRLLAQCRTVEQVETSSAKSAGAVWKTPGSNVASDHGTKEASNEEWNEFQGPVRAQMARLADVWTQKFLKASKTVTKKNCANFAVGMLRHVRKRFYAEVAKDLEAARSRGVEPIAEPIEGPWTRKLTLENMRWMFDTKIRPWTDCHKKDLFLCSACGASGKAFGLESVIQHYAAKHTDALSKGSMVVNWRAEWPEKSIFHTQPGPSIPGIAESQPPHAPQVFSSSSQAHPFNPAAESVIHAPLKRPEALEKLPPAATTSHRHQGDPPELPQPVVKGDGNGSSNFNLTIDPRHYPFFHSEAKFRGMHQDGPNHAYASEVDLMAKVVMGTWSVLSRVKNVPSSVKTCTIIHHIAKRYQQVYSEAAPLEAFRDGLDQHDSFAPLRNVQNLTCKACTLLSVQPHAKGTYTLLKLVDHFYLNHGKFLIDQRRPPDDWRFDMVLLPEGGALKGLGAALRNKGKAFQLVSDALPWAFYGEARGNGKAAEPARQPAPPVRQKKPAKAVQACTPAPATVPHHGKAAMRPTPSSFQDVPLLRPASVVYGAQPVDHYSPAPAEYVGSLVPRGRRRDEPGRMEYVEDRRLESDRDARRNRRSASPRTTAQGYGHAPYRERSPGPRCAPVSHEYDRYSPYSHHHMPRDEGHLPPRPVPPFQTYELIKVQDYQGDYLIRRPVRVDEGEMMRSYAAASAAIAPPLPRYSGVYQYSPNDHKPTMHEERRPSPFRSPEYGEYDPKRPTVGSG